MTVKFSAYMDAIFHPLLKKAYSTNNVKTGKLKTVEFSDPLMRDYQYNRLSIVDVHIDNVMHLSNGDFFTYFKCGANYYVCVSVEFFDSNEIDTIVGIFAEYESYQHRLEENFLLSFCYYLNGVYKPKLSISSQEIIQNLGLGVQEEQPDYKGHDYEDIISLYTPIIIFKIEQSSLLLNVDSWFLSCLIAIECASLRYKDLSDRVMEISRRFLIGKNVSFENIYLSLTSSHYKYHFLEIYRCIEALYYLPWMLDLKVKSGVVLDAFNLAMMVSSSIQWREKEKPSIYYLFTHLPFSIFNTGTLEQTSFFSSLLGAKLEDTEEFKKRLAGVIYRIRNQSVHQSDYEYIDSIQVTQSDWMILSEFMYSVVEYLYTKYKADISVYNCSFKPLVTHK